VSHGAKEAKPAASRLELVRDFNELPDEALVDVRSFSAVLGVGETSGWKILANDPDAPKKVRLSPGCTRLQVGDARRFIRSKVSA
jgi:hypothetical protein